MTHKGGRGEEEHGSHDAGHVHDRGERRSGVVQQVRGLGGGEVAGGGDGAGQGVGIRPPAVHGRRDHAQQRETQRAAEVVAGLRHRRRRPGAFRRDRPHDQTRAQREQRAGAQRRHGDAHDHGHERSRAGHLHAARCPRSTRTASAHASTAPKTRNSTSGTSPLLQAYCKSGPRPCAQHFVRGDARHAQKVAFAARGTGFHHGRGACRCRHGERLLRGCDELNATCGPHLYCKTDVYTGYDSDYEYSADGWLKYDVDSDGKGRLPVMQLTGSPVIH